MTKFIFVTGGVVSSLGKGIAVASIGRMLKSRGLTVSVLKLDPYLNVDPGTMSPYQHGEVFVTIDGSETDLDLGHYERFIDVELTELSNVTAGQIYSEVISNERAGHYLGGTIQTVPHVTNLIKDRVLLLAEKSKADVVVVEVGGTVGDIEGQPFIEAIRQVRNIVGSEDTYYIHVTLLPYLGATGELKTKPTQHSVHTLRGMGIQPNAILCRADQTVNESERQKISLYCDVPADAVISLPTLSSVYEVPIHLEAEGLGDILISELDLPKTRPDLDSWRTIVKVDEEERDEVDIALVGKYIELQDSYLSVVEALHHAGLHNERKINIKWIPAEDLEAATADQLLGSVQGIIVPGGFGKRGLEGMIATASYARSNGVPYLGLCLGMRIENSWQPILFEIGRARQGVETHLMRLKYRPVSIIVFLRQRVVLVVVTFAAVQRQSKKSLSCVFDGFVKPRRSVKQIIIARQKSSCSQPISIDRIQLIGGQHFQDHLVVTLVSIE